MATVPASSPVLCDGENKRLALQVESVKLGHRPPRDEYVHDFPLSPADIQHRSAIVARASRPSLFPGDRPARDNQIELVPGLHENADRVDPVGYPSRVLVKLMGLNVFLPGERAA